MNNVLYVNKPRGITSFDVCFKLRKILNTKKIGHTGTLDPMAEGVMIVLFDNATKANQFIVTHNKKYHAHVIFGTSTDTLDITGNIIKKSDFVVPDENKLIEVLNSFKGKSLQEVPITSAVKVNGKKLYEYQRQNEEVKLPIREIEVFSIQLESIYKNGFSFICEVSSGTYIRALVRDILSILEIDGCLSALKRLSLGDVNIEDCDNLDDILNGKYRLHNLYEILSKQYETVEYINIDDIKNGKKIQIDAKNDEVLICNNKEVLAIYKKDGTFYKCVRGLW